MDVLLNTILQLSNLVKSIYAQVPVIVPCIERVMLTTEFISTFLCE